MHTRFWWGNLRERDHFEDPRVEERIILEWMFENSDGKALIGSMSQDRDT